MIDGNTNLSSLTRPTRSVSMESTGSLAGAMKRQRAGSVSSRLRAASDLEEFGLIDKNQKGVIKDLIISGDAAVQDALDRFHQGDKEHLLGQ